MVAKPLYQTLNPTKLCARGFLDPNPSRPRLVAVSNWTRVGGSPTLHDLRRPPTGQGFGAPHPSRHGAGRPPTLHDFSRRSPHRFTTWGGAPHPSPKTGKSMTGPFGPERTPNAKPKFCSWYNGWLWLGRVWFGWLDGFPRCEWCLGGLGVGISAHKTFSRPMLHPKP